MGEREPIDLGQLDPPRWRVLVKNVAYGPYTLGQIKAFIAEGRVSLNSKLADGDGAPFQQAADIALLGREFEAKATKARATATETPIPQNYLIVCRLSQTPEARFVSAMNTLGNFGEAMPSVYLLRSTLKLAAVQQSLREIVSDSDQVVIVNATMNRLGWFNLGMEADVHVRSIWDKPVGNTGDAD